MKSCPRQWELLQLSGRALSGELASHLATCESCRDSLAIQECLQADADDVASAARIPPATTMLWKAKLVQARRARLRALAPIAFVENVCGAAVVLTIVAALWSHVPDMPAQQRMLSLTIASAVTGLSLAVLAARAFFGGEAKTWF